MKKNEELLLIGFVLFLLVFLWLLLRKPATTVTDTIIKKEFVNTTLSPITFNLETTKSNKCNTCSTVVAEAQQNAAEILKQKQDELIKNLDGILKEVEGQYYAV